MSKAVETIACPICGTELTIAQIFTHEDTRLAFQRLATVSIPLGARVIQYVTLFAPPKTRLTLPKQVKLILQLLPDLERRAITHKGREWAAPLDAWAHAFDQMLQARDAGRLDLPMSGHGYLYAILAGLADRQESAAERQVDADRRARSSSGGTQQLGDVVDKLATPPTAVAAAPTQPQGPSRAALRIQAQIAAARERRQGAGGQAAEGGAE